MIEIAPCEVGSITIRAVVDKPKSSGVVEDGVDEGLSIKDLARDLWMQVSFWGLERCVLLEKPGKSNGNFICPEGLKGQSKLC